MFASQFKPLIESISTIEAEQPKLKTLYPKLIRHLPQIEMQYAGMKTYRVKLLYINSLNHKKTQTDQFREISLNKLCKGSTFDTLFKLLSRVYFKERISRDILRLFRGKKTLRSTFFTQNKSKPPEDLIQNNFIRNISPKLTRFELKKEQSAIKPHILFSTP